MPIAHVNGIELYFERVGEGPPLTMIHGLGSSGDDWAFQREEFAREHSLLLPDLRGSGRSAKPLGPYSIAQFAADLWRLNDTLGIEYTDILGFSLGGAVALEMALARPERVRRLVLCNALANYRLDTWRKRLEARLQLALVQLCGLRLTGRFVAGRMFPQADQAPKRRRVIDVIGANSKAAYLATVHALIGWSALERLPALSCPALILAAEHDYTPLAEKRAEAALFADARVEVVAGSRHGTPFDAIAEFNSKVLAFLAAPR
ncbi:MAG TPA: alpha/beta hydrolase [Rudaea sp.]|nr:alpha/beta hydrolase [Rudaea sp.]